MKVDIFSHIIPAKYQEALVKKAKNSTAHLEGWVKQNPALSDVEIRLRRVDRYPDMLEVLVPALAPLEAFVSAADAPDLAKINNDESAAIVEKYPDRFMAAVALLPLSDIDAAVKEAGRACMGLGLRGILMNTTINGEPMDLPKFRPLFAKMVEYDIPRLSHRYKLLRHQSRLPSTAAFRNRPNILNPKRLNLYAGMRKPHWQCCGWQCPGFSKNIPASSSLSITAAGWYRSAATK
jgi:predicted TIM-barrel fold metal-dependent hydrolase